MSLVMRALSSPSSSFPRVSGDEPIRNVNGQEAILFSPREWG